MLDDAKALRRPKRTCFLWHSLWSAPDAEATDAAGRCRPFLVSEQNSLHFGTGRAAHLLMSHTQVLVAAAAVIAGSTMYP